ncbi:MAG: DUF2461 domain-containing protein [Ignavibacteriaceae bacterium]|nr:DUF2461 domain-containing protein [Ignavibacteriaceae bacterium]
MTKFPAFENFPKKTVDFLKKLSKNNNKEWFEEHRDDYNSRLLEPAFQFVTEMGDELSAIVPNIMAVPKIDKSVFRLHRDVRFSKDKSPYKTNLGIYLWEGKKKMESSGFYFHIDPKGFFISSGIYMPSKEQIKIIRDAVVDPLLGNELSNVIKKVLKRGDYTLGGKTYKKIPRGYDPSSPNAEYLLYYGLYAYYESSDFSELTNKDIIDYSFKKYKDMLPLHQWLVKILK